MVVLIEDKNHSPNQLNQLLTGKATTQPINLINHSPQKQPFTAKNFPVNKLISIFVTVEKIK
jgi:hypothetical protein